VFEKFYSLARPHSNKKSTGLGLSFVKEIAELHHGRVSLKNAAGGGALATLSLPLDGDATAAAS
jgi:two-component system sensor histidine kinase CreC